MINRNRLLLALLVGVAALLLTACGGSGSPKDPTDYEHLRDVSWEGTELTIKLGENKSTGCEWKTDPQDDSVIDYSTNRVFKLADSEVKDGKAVGTLSAGFKGKGAGTSQVVCTTPVDWDGTGDGYTYIVTVTVNEDGTIKDAKGEESEEKPAEQKAMTLEDYFDEHPEELKEMQKKLNQNDSYKDLVTIDLKVKGNNLSYIYTFKETYSDDQIKAFKPDLKKSMKGELKDELKDKIKAMEKGFGVNGISIYMEYRNGDGTKIYGTTYE